MAIRSQLFNAYLDTDPDAARKVAKGADELKQIAAVLEKAGKTDAVLDVLGAMAETRSGRSRRARGPRAGLRRARRSREGPHVSLGGNGGHQSRAVADAGRDGAARQPIPRRQGRGRPGADARSRPDAGGRRPRLPAGRERIRKPAISRSTPSPTPRWREGDFAAAAVALHEFTTRVRSHLVALMRLVEICVDGGLEATMYEAQAALADAYLDRRPRHGSAHHQRRPGRARAVEQASTSIASAARW